MSKKIFVNLHVKDLDKSIEFFKKLGFNFNAQFTNDKAASMVISDDIYAMLVTEPFFKTFTPKSIADTSKTSEVLIALSVDSNEEVNTMVNAALAAGGKEPRKATDHGFMYTRAFEDLDGHIWEILYMDQNYVK